MGTPVTAISQELRPTVLSRNFVFANRSFPEFFVVQWLRLCAGHFRQHLSVPACSRFFPGKTVFACAWYLSLLVQEHGWVDWVVGNH